MNLLKTKRFIGIDVGLATTKMVVLEKHRREIRILHSGVLRHRDDGIEDEQDLATQVGEFIRNEGFANGECIISIPEYYGIMQVSDFPPTDDARQLAALVNYETQQLAGLANEGFISDHHQCEPFYKFQNPVVLSVCREPLVRAKLRTLSQANLNIADVTMEGMALANAFMFVEPQAKERSELLLVLDIGAANSTFALMMNGQVFYAGSCPFGGDMFTEALAQHLQIPMLEAETVKYTSRIIMSDLNSPVSASARALSGELQAALDQWRMQVFGEDEPDPALGIGGIYLCGGGSLLPGIEDFFEAVYECPVNRLTVTYRKDISEAVLYPIAFGLALQGFPSGESACPISMAPLDVQLMTKRRLNYPLLLGATWLLTALLILFLILGYVSLYLSDVRLTNQRKELQQSELLIPEVVNIKRAIDYQNAMLTLFVARANRNRTFVQAIDLLGDFQQDPDWLVYLADGESYGLLDESKARALAATTTTMEVVKPKSPLHQKEVQARPPPLEHHLITDLQPWRRLIASGFTPRKDRNPLENIRMTVESLNNDERTIFQGVDRLPEPEIRHKPIMEPWQDKYRMRDFHLELPLRNPDFDPERVKENLR